MKKININRLLRAIEKKCEEEKISPTWFGQKYLGNVHMYDRLKDGKHVSILTYNKILDVIGER